MIKITHIFKILIIIQKYVSEEKFHSVADNTEFGWVNYRPFAILIWTQYKIIHNFPALSLPLSWNKFTPISKCEVCLSKKICTYLKLCTKKMDCRNLAERVNGLNFLNKSDFRFPHLVFPIFRTHLHHSIHTRTSNGIHSTMRMSNHSYLSMLKPNLFTVECKRACNAKGDILFYSFGEAL